MSVCVCTTRHSICNVRPSTITYERSSVWWYCMTNAVLCRTRTLILFLKFYVYSEMNKPQSQDYSPIGFSIYRSEYRIFIFFTQFRGLCNRFLAFSEVPGSFRELQEAGRNHFHLSSYMSLPVITSYGQKPWGKIVFAVYLLKCYFSISKHRLK